MQDLTCSMPPGGVERLNVPPGLAGISSTECCKNFLSTPKRTTWRRSAAATLRVSIGTQGPNSTDPPVVRDQAQLAQIVWNSCPQRPHFWKMRSRTWSTPGESWPKSCQKRPKSRLAGRSGRNSRRQIPIPAPTSARISSLGASRIWPDVNRLGPPSSTRFLRHCARVARSASESFSSFRLDHPSGPAPLARRLYANWPVCRCLTHLGRVRQSWPKCGQHA